MYIHKREDGLLRITATCKYFVNHDVHIHLCPVAWLVLHKGNHVNMTLSLCHMCTQGAKVNVNTLASPLRRQDPDC